MNLLQDADGREIPCITGSRSGQILAVLPGGTLNVIENGKMKSRSTRVPGVVSVSEGQKFLAYLYQAPGQSLATFLQLGNANQELKIDPQSRALKFSKPKYLAKKMEASPRVRQLQQQAPRKPESLEEFRNLARQLVPNRGH